MQYSDPVVIDPRTTPTKGLSQAYALRDVAYQLALKLGCKSTDLSDHDSEQARAVTNLVKAWAEADDRIRIHRGKPLPGSLRPVAKKRGRKAVAEDPVVYPGPSSVSKPATIQDESSCGVVPTTAGVLQEKNIQSSPDPKPQEEKP